jgi:hypothetical protein
MCHRRPDRPRPRSHGSNFYAWQGSLIKTDKMISKQSVLMASFSGGQSLSHWRFSDQNCRSQTFSPAHDDLKTDRQTKVCEDRQICKASRDDSTIMLTVAADFWANFECWRPNAFRTCNALKNVGNHRIFCMQIWNTWLRLATQFGAEPKLIRQNQHRNLNRPIVAPFWCEARTL